MFEQFCYVLRLKIVSVYSKNLILVDFEKSFKNEQSINQSNEGSTK